MANVEKQLEDLEFKIKQIARKIELIKDENIQLVKENTELRELLDQKQDIVSKQPATIEFEGEKSGEEEKNRLRAELDSYVEEIDQCIQLLETI